MIMSTSHQCHRHCRRLDYDTCVDTGGRVIRGRFWSLCEPRARDFGGGCTQGSRCTVSYPWISYALSLLKSSLDSFCCLNTTSGVAREPSRPSFVLPVQVHPGQSQEEKSSLASVPSTMRCTFARPRQGLLDVHTQFDVTRLEYRKKGVLSPATGKTPRWSLSYAPIGVHTT